MDTHEVHGRRAELPRTRRVQRRRRDNEGRCDGIIQADLYDEFMAKSHKELIEIPEQKRAHAEADREFLEYGMRFFDLAQAALLS